MTPWRTLRAMAPPGSDPIRVALLGFGFAGRIFHAPFIATTRGLRLHVVASTRRDEIARAHPEARVVDTPLEAIEDEDVELVVVATPNHLHAPLAEAALQAGKHVVVDKPFTVTLEEARRVVAMAAATGQVLSVFQNRRFDSDHQALQAALAAGVIGEVVEYRSEIARWRPEVRDRWRERPGPGAGLWYDLGPHLIDQALHLFGMPEAVQATVRALRPGATVDDWFHARLSYPSRQVFITSSMLAADAPPRVVVRGTTGSLVKHGMDPQEGRLLAGSRPGAADWGHDAEPVRVLRDGEPPADLPTPAGDYGRFYALMRDAIRYGAPPPVTPEDAVDVMTILHAGLESSASGREVKVK